LIVDVQVEGVSQLSLTRSQFKTVLKDKGVGGLLAVLDEKINALELEK
jgi:ABC-type transporter MlaC component